MDRERLGQGPGVVDGAGHTIVARVLCVRTTPVSDRLAAVIAAFLAMLRSDTNGRAFVRLTADDDARDG
jgi:hypothetical protein